MKTRRQFLQLLGTGLAAAAVPAALAGEEWFDVEVPEPERRIWQVSRSAPVAAKRIGSIDVTWEYASDQWPLDPYLANMKTRIEAMAESANRHLELTILYGNDTDTWPRDVPAVFEHFARDGWPPARGVLVEVDDNSARTGIWSNWNPERPRTLAGRLNTLNELMRLQSESVLELDNGAIASVLATGRA